MRNLIGQLTLSRILKITVISSLLSLIIFYVIDSNDQNLQPIYIDSFVLDDLDGQPLDILDLHNQQPLIINFWATWCAPCRKEMPLLNNYYLTNLVRLLKYRFNRILKKTFTIINWDYGTNRDVHLYSP